MTENGHHGEAEVEEEAAGALTPEQLQRAVAQIEQQKQVAGVEGVPPLVYQMIGELSVGYQMLLQRVQRAEEFAGALIREKKERETTVEETLG